jgi:altronate hydrolase
MSVQAVVVPAVLRAHPEDSVSIAVRTLASGDGVDDCVTARNAIPPGHKVSLRAHAAGDPVIKFGQPIGRASAPIAPGEHVHTHNLQAAGGADRSRTGTRLVMPPRFEASFDGFVRPSGKVGTRNFVAVLPSVNCSAMVTRRIAAHFDCERLAGWPGVDGVAAFTHASGCGMAKGGEGLANLQRTLAGYARHPNFGGVLLVGLGCEVNQLDSLLAHAALAPSAPVRTLTIQDSGGTRAAIAAGIAAVEELLAIAASARRSDVSAAHLTLGLQCGGSDGYSALTANPALGVAADLLVGAGGRVILSETPEIYGAENLLLERAVSHEVAAALIDRIEWWESYAVRNGADLDNNPSPGNIAGGITTILEKSLGAIAKSGTSPLVDVVGYAAPVTRPGLTFMDTPGYDPCSATGQIAGGANLVAFTTGRGSVFGSKPAPTLKIASTSDLARRMAEDIDVDCGSVLEGGAGVQQMGEYIFGRLLALASGEKSKSEIADMGEEEYVPWVPGAAL